MMSGALKKGDARRMCASGDILPAELARKDGDPGFIADLLGKPVLERVVKCGKQIAEDTGYGQINLIITPKGIEYVTYQVWWKPPKVE
jgi:hypothetical protein